MEVNTTWKRGMMEVEVVEREVVGDKLMFQEFLPSMILSNPLFHLVLMLRSERLLLLFYTQI